MKAFPTLASTTGSWGTSSRSNARRAGPAAVLASGSSSAVPAGSSRRRNSPASGLASSARPDTPSGCRTPTHTTPATWTATSSPPAWVAARRADETTAGAKRPDERSRFGIYERLFICFGGRSRRWRVLGGTVDSQGLSCLKARSEARDVRGATREPRSARGLSRWFQQQHWRPQKRHILSLR